MKCKILGVWNSNGSGQNEKGQAFTWNNFYFSYSYTDKKQSHMIGEKTDTVKIKASDLNQILGMGLSSVECNNLLAENFESLYHVKGAICSIDFDTDSNLIDFEILQEGKEISSTSSAVHAPAKS